MNPVSWEQDMRKRWAESVRDTDGRAARDV
jgi:hypothetical protein